MINFKKNGRPTKSEKSLLKSINNFFSSLSDEDKGKYGFNNETVTDGNRLTEIWDVLSGNPKKAEVKAEPLPEKKPLTEQAPPESEMNVNEEVIKENIEEKQEKPQEETNFVKQQEDMDKAEDAEILEELTENSGTEAEEIPSFFNPNRAPVEQRSYNKQENVDVGEIKEPDFGKAPSVTEQLEDIEKESQSFERKEERRKEEEEQEEQDEIEEAKPVNRLTNEPMNEMSGKEKNLAAKQLVQSVLDGYEMLHDLAKNFVKYPEDKLQEAIIKEEIDATMEIPIDAIGTTVNPVEFFKAFNEDAEEAMSYDPEFGEKVRAPMERIFAKKGWGMTDEQFVMVAFGKDIAWKGMQIINLRKTANGIMDTFKELQREKIEAMKSGASDHYEAPSSITHPSQPQREAARPIVQEEEVYEEEPLQEEEEVSEEA